MKKTPRIVNEEDRKFGYSYGFRGDEIPHNSHELVIATRSSEFLEGWLDGAFDRIRKEK